ncbi:MAG: protein kinase [Saprospiraceae bacterium]
MKTIEEGLVLNDRYELVKFIGKGGFSQVWLARDRQNADAEVAMKIFVSNSGLTEEELETFRIEYENTRELNDEQLLTPTDQFDYGNSPCLVLPFMEGGSLENKIRKQGRLPEEEIGKIVYQIGRGLRVLESHQVLHNDIKPDNMLIDGRGDFHLADFGISAKMRNTFLRASRLRGETFNYRSPEKIQGDDVNAQSDIFSLGVTLYEVCKGIFPEGVSLGDNVIRGYPKPSIDTTFYSRRLEQLIHACLNKGPLERPTAARLEAYADHFLKNGFWEEITEFIPEEEYVRRTVPRSGSHETPAGTSQAMSGTAAVPAEQATRHTPPPKAGSGNNTFRIAMGALALVALLFVGFVVYDMVSEPSNTTASVENPLPEVPKESLVEQPKPDTPIDTQQTLVSKEAEPVKEEPPKVEPLKQEQPKTTLTSDPPVIKKPEPEKPTRSQEQLFKDAVDEFDNRKYTNAINTLNEYMRSNTSDWRAYYLRGSAHLSLDHYSSAISDLTRAINLDPSNCNNYSARALAYHQSGNLSSAIPDYRNATNKGCDETYNNYGFALFDYGSYEDAKKKFSKALTLSNRDKSSQSDTYIGMAITLYKLGDYDKSKAYLQKATELEPCFGRSTFESCVKSKGLWYSSKQSAAIKLVQRL